MKQFIFQIRKKLAESIYAAAGAVAGLLYSVGLVESIRAPRFKYEFECRDKDGNLKWVDGFTNLVTTAGKNDLLTQYFKGATYTAAWYIALIDNAGFSAVAAGDTAASHAGWTESVAYSNANRPTLSFGTASAASLAATAATFNINGTATINGAFSITNNTKSGTTGVLYSAGSFGATRAVTNGDTLNVTLTVTA
jgi:hypothetical protein